MFRRDRVYTFSDADNLLYTVTNVPDLIKIPPGTDPNPIENKTFRELLTPSFAIAQAPEIAYIFRSPPIQDPLLSRLCLEVANLHPIHYTDNNTWGLSLDLRKSWSRLEKALGFAIDRLLMLRNSPAASSANQGESWPDPSACGYLRLYPTSYKARVAIRKSRDAMIILAARCSLALAVWDTSQNPECVPTWVPFLEKEGLPSYWIDALNASVISRFSHMLRVGAIIDPVLCQWLPHVPVMRQAKVPIILRWTNRASIEPLCTQYPFLRQFAPSSAQDASLALAAPPRPQAPSVYKLYLDGKGRPHPFDRELEERLAPKPHGPFQLPGESRTAFLARMLQRAESMKTRETPPQAARRIDREEYAAAGNLPKPYTRVYLWIEASHVYPDLPDAWRALDYRAEVHHSCVPDLWHQHGPGVRSYNALFDEWDLWSDQTTAEQLLIAGGLSTNLIPTDYDAAGNRHDSISNEDFPPPATLPATYNNRDVSSRSSIRCNPFLDAQEIFTAENDILYQQVDEAQYDIVDFSEWYLENQYLSERYGLHPAPEHDSVVVSDSVDYTVFAGPAMFDIFAFGIEPQPSFCDRDKKTFAGCAWALLQGKTDSPVLVDCWDMSPQCPHFLFKDDHARRIVKVVKIAGEAQSQLYSVVYAHDREDVGWKLLVNSRVLVLLLRWLDRVSTIEDAAFELSQIGAPFSTCKVSTDAALSMRRSSPHFGNNYSLLPSYRLDGYAHNFLDYRQYSQQVLDFLRSGPCARAAMLHGGLIWRLVVEFSSLSDGIVELIRWYVCHGPTDDSKHNSVIARTGGLLLVDDSLSEKEQAMLCGVTRVYTTQRNQTEERSWWPKPSLWRTSGMFTGIWNPRNEQWFQKRLKEIKMGTAMPLRTRDWRTALGMYRHCNKLAKTTDTWTSQVIDRYVV